MLLFILFFENKHMIFQEYLRSIENIILIRPNENVSKKFNEGFANNDEPTKNKIKGLYINFIEYNNNINNDGNGTNE